MQKFQFGTSTVYIDEDLVYTINEGPIDLAMTKGYLEQVDPIIAQYGRVFMLTNAKDNFAMTSEARRYVAEWAKTHTFTASAFFGAGPLSRAMYMLLVRAMQLLGKSRDNLAFFATESEARAWIDEQRTKFLATRAAKERQP